jgi:hypothetical protein
MMQIEKRLSEIRPSLKPKSCRQQIRPCECCR